ncbi:MAG: DUF4388 domain-containing protein, partial [Proteobacteria bacterium]|nr:DUF4388 domain-containing protein [Pseudomonadota bacterium]
MKEPLESALRSSSVSAKPQRVYALKFISGKYQGGEFALPAEGEIIVGRSSDQNMVLVEDMVSRRHARISVEGGDVFIRDLKSTNGTFVNGERISEAKLSEGDRVLIGTSIMKLVRSSESSPPRAKPKGQPEGVRRRASQVQRMTGSIEEVPLPDLLQLFSSSKKNGVLVVRTETDVGKLYLDAGQVVYATLNDDDTLGAEKSLYRIVGWTAGTFCLESQPEEEFPRELNVSTEGLLMEAMRRMDEMARLD